MAEGGAEPDETGALRDRIAKLEGDLRETQAILGQCVLTTVSASIAVQTLSRDFMSTIGSGDVPLNALHPLAFLDKHLQTLIKLYEEAARGG